MLHLALPRAARPALRSLALAAALGGTDEGRAVASRALALYEEKGSVVAAERARALTATGARTASRPG